MKYCKNYLRLDTINSIWLNFKYYLIIVYYSNYGLRGNVKVSGLNTWVFSLPTVKSLYTLCWHKNG